MTKRVDELVQNICGADHPLAPVLRGWCQDSRPFLAFAGTHATKLRKKARLAPGGGDLDDLLAELAVAAFLVRDRRLALQYEPHRATGERGPDFQAIFKTHSPFNVEVTRLRLPSSPSEDLTGAALRLARVVGDKIGQCPPGAVNVLAVVVPPGVGSGALVPAAIRLLERGSQPEAILPPGGVRTYLRGRQRLSAVALCSFTDAWQPLTVGLWLNPRARHPLSPDVARYLVQTPA